MILESDSQRTIVIWSAAKTLITCCISVYHKCKVYHLSTNHFLDEENFRAAAWKVKYANAILKCVGRIERTAEIGAKREQAGADRRDFTPRPWSVISRQLLARQEVRHHTCALALTFLHNVKSGTGRVGRSSWRPTIAKEQWNDESFFGSRLGWRTE